MSSRQSIEDVLNNFHYPIYITVGGGVAVLWPHKRNLRGIKVYVNRKAKELCDKVTAFAIVANKPFIIYSRGQ